jgi:hypothetical protein
MTQRAGEKPNAFRGRQFCSTGCARTSLTPELVREIRKSSRPLRELSLEYRLGITTVHHIKSRRTWAWLED